MPTNTSMIRSALAQKIREFARDNRGVNLIEFAFAAPFIMALYLGTLTAIDMEASSGQVGKVTSTVSDIISQSPTVDKFAVKNAFDAAGSLVSNAQNLEIYLAGIQITEDGTPVVLWSTANKDTLSTLSLPPAGSVYDRLPDDLKNREGFIVATRGKMSHTTLFSPDKKYYEYSNYFVPRVSILTLCDACQQEN